MKYDSNQIVTSDNSIEVGKQYDYSEDGQRMRVLLLEDTSNKDGIKDGINLKLKILSEPFGEIFDVYAKLGERYFYNGMWRLWDAGEYIRGVYPENGEVIPDGPLIGYSLSKCVGSILRNNIELGRVGKIISRTAMKTDDSFNRVCRGYENQYWYKYSGRGTEIAKQLWEESKIFQPRLGEPGVMKNDVVWEKARILTDEERVAIWIKHLNETKREYENLQTVESFIKNNPRYIEILDSYNVLKFDCLLEKD